MDCSHAEDARLVAAEKVAIVRRGGAEGHMSTGYRSVSVAALAVLALGVVGCGNATAVEFKDISGKWCTRGGTEEFDRDSLTAIPVGTNQRHVYPVERYDFRANNVTVVWRDDKRGESYTTDFANFSADGRHMVQLKNSAGPRREFHRC